MLKMGYFENYYLYNRGYVFTLINLNKLKIEKQLILNKNNCPSNWNEKLIRPQDYEKETNYLFDLAKSIDYYEMRDYREATFYILRVLGFLEKHSSLNDVEDLQKEGNGIPDFVVYKTPPPNEQKFELISDEELMKKKFTKKEKSYGKYYVEFKGESDSLRMKQLLNFIKMCQFREKILILCVEKNWDRGRNDKFKKG